MDCVYNWLLGGFISLKTLKNDKLCQIENIRIHTSRTVRKIHEDASWSMVVFDLFNKVRGVETATQITNLAASCEVSTEGML